jgi:hypothetical protein
LNSLRWGYTKANPQPKIQTASYIRGRSVCGSRINLIPFLDMQEHLTMAKAKSPSGGKSTRTSKNQPNVNDPANIPSATPVQQQAVNPSVQVAASTSASEPQIASDPIKAEAADKTSATKSNTEKNSKPDGKVDGSSNKMFEVKKAEPRRNVVPINIEDEIRRRAYELFQQRGHGSGSEAEDWVTAEREVMQRYHQQSA